MESRMYTAQAGSIVIDSSSICQTRNKKIEEQFVWHSAINSEDDSESHLANCPFFSDARICALVSV